MPPLADRAPGPTLRRWLVTDDTGDYMVGELRSGTGAGSLHCPSCDSATCEHCAVVREVVDASEGE